MIRDVIRKAHAGDVKIGICGQAPSNYSEYAEFLVEARENDSISLNPDSFIATIRRVAEAEQRLNSKSGTGRVDRKAK